MSTTRRDILKGGGAATVLIMSGASLTAAASTPSAPLPAWIVGTPGEYNWQFIRAATSDQARRFWAEDQVGVDCEDGMPASGCDCDTCYAFNGADTERRGEWDDFKHEPTPADWLRSGVGYSCARCRDEADPYSGARAVGDEAVCESCLTPCEQAVPIEVMDRG